MIAASRVCVRGWEKTRTPEHSYIVHCLRIHVQCCVICALLFHALLLQLGMGTGTQVTPTPAQLCTPQATAVPQPPSPQELHVRVHVHVSMGSALTLEISASCRRRATTATQPPAPPTQPPLETPILRLRGHPKPFAARFHSICAVCNGVIRPLDPIYWSQASSGWTHAQCRLAWQGMALAPQG